MNLPYLLSFVNLNMKRKVMVTDFMTIHMYGYIVKSSETRVSRVWFCIFYHSNGSLEESSMAETTANVWFSADNRTFQTMSHKGILYPLQPGNTQKMKFHWLKMKVEKIEIWVSWKQIWERLWCGLLSKSLTKI